MGLAEFLRSKGSDLENKSELMLDELPAMVLITDPDGKIVYTNGHIETELGFSSQHLKDTPIWHLYKDQQKGERLFNEWKKEAKVNEVNSFHVQLHIPNETKKCLNVKVRKLRISKLQHAVIWSACDVSRLKVMEQDLAKSKARVEAILESATEGIFTTNKKGIIQTLNSAVEQIFGYSESEMIGEALCSFVTMLTTEFAEADLVGKRKLLMGQNRQIQAKHKDGHLFAVELSLNKITVGDEVIFTGLIRDLSESRKLEAEILKIAENERLKLGQELHDGVGQMLSAIAMISGNLARKAKANSLPGADELDGITTMIQEADQEIRQLSHGLAHVELENEGLQVALKGMCERFQSISKTRCQYICSPGLEITDYMISLHLYRIVQESIQNAIKHGDPDEIIVKLQKNQNFINLTIEDNGDGLKEGMNKIKLKGMGLSTMQYRAEILGGNFSIEKTSNGWVKVRCIIPLQNGQNS